MDPSTLDRKRDFRFCPLCGGRLAWSSVVDEEPLRLQCRACGFVFYLDPKLAVSVVIDWRRSILLLKRAIAPSLGKWVVPGGFVDLGERVEDAAVRETREEANLDVTVDRLLGVYSYQDSEVVIVFYSARWHGGTPSPGREALEVRFFPYEDIPWNDLAFPSTVDGLREYLEGVR